MIALIKKSIVFKRSQVNKKITVIQCIWILTSTLKEGDVEIQNKIELVWLLKTRTSVCKLRLVTPCRGLDSSSTSSCVRLLRDLAREGRTVVCTIHQPSALVFEQFDHLYAVAGGRCVYQGSIPQLVPHMASVGLVCPRSHNPADFRESTARTLLCMCVLVSVCHYKHVHCIVRIHPHLFSSIL